MRFGALLSEAVSYAGRLALLAAVPLAAFGLFVPIVASPPLFAVVLPVVVVLAYLFFPVPYLVVLEDRRLLEAFDRSLSLTTGGSEPVVFFVGYALLAAGASVPLSALSNAGVPGVLAAAVLASGTGLVLTTFTVLFVRELIDGDRTELSTGAATPGPD